ncbi:amidophosphoribosyltransferase [Brachybacterium avium]|uniref:Amidophosphoribosyltransferase n=1 Tax=Brachybacterium avium TaxID=2017485 RepID=A0A220U9D0_9MICO|nr:phosphoribosyltransferase family protein [Brachybacterium avium]ASK64914.1 amidophosphoribosyltransferase [Brachybacterium avium]
MAQDEGPSSPLREVIAQTCALLAPRQCPCGEEGTWLCRRCASLLDAEPRRVESSCDALQVLTAARVRQERRGELSLPAGVDHTPLLPVLALGEYAGDLQRLVLAWKNGGMLHLGPRIAPALAPAVTQLSAAAGVAAPGLVPVPSRRSARLRRGEDHTAELVRAIERNDAGRALLVSARPTTAQDGQGARQRRNRRIQLRGRRARAAGRRAQPVIIVDDVVTTGSTLRGMHAALSEAGMEVLGAVVVAAARMPSPGTDLDSGA